MTNANWAVVLAYNNMNLTKAAVQSLRAQDIGGGVRVLVIDNGSQDGTSAWLDSQPDLFGMRFTKPLSVAAAWNWALRWLFVRLGEPHALVVNNDVQLRPDTYRWLVKDGGLFVTAVGKRDPLCIQPTEMTGGSNGGFDDAYTPPDPKAKRPHPDFSCYLMRRECWDRVGEFDEGFERAFCEDWDYHWRMQAHGIKAECLELPFYHVGSATIHTADAREVRAIQKQAELNRAYFKRKWGVEGGSEGYYGHFGGGAPTADAEEEQV